MFKTTNQKKLSIHY